MDELFSELDSNQIILPLLKSGKFWSFHRAHVFFFFLFAARFKGRRVGQDGQKGFLVNTIPAVNY